MKINASAALLTAACLPCTAVYAADNTRIGYGQGTNVDENNRPVDAVQFNSRFGDLDAFALSGDDKRIIITFDQGYENGYTAKILDTLKEKDVQAIFFLTGPYAKTRNPQYTGLIFICTALLFFSGNAFMYILPIGFYIFLTKLMQNTEEVILSIRFEFISFKEDISLSKLFILFFNSVIIFLLSFSKLFSFKS